MTGNLQLLSEDEIANALASGSWPEWRSSRAHEPRRLADGARSWCVSPYWDRHTPRLEDWKCIVADMAAEGLSADGLSFLAAATPRRLAFPVIPLFELEQLSDLVGVVTDPAAAAVLAAQPAATDCLLSTVRHDVLRLCWERMARQFNDPIEYSAWRWMALDHSVEGQAWPSPAGIQALYRMKGSRRDEALQSLEAAARAAVESGAGEQGAAVVIKELERLRSGPSAQRDAPQYRGSLDSGELRTATGVAKAQSGEERSAAAQEICRELFYGPVDVSKWDVLAGEIANWSPEGNIVHPMAFLVDYLRQAELPVALDQRAWERFSAVIQDRRGLLGVAEPGSPPPAFELAVSRRSELSMGQVAIELMQLAGDLRRDPAWWAAVKAGLRPMVRRAGWHVANDRIDLAVSAVTAQARLLSSIEQQALAEGFAGRPDHVR